MVYCNVLFLSLSHPKQNKRTSELHKNSKNQHKPKPRKSPTNMSRKRAAATAAAAFRNLAVSNSEDSVDSMMSSNRVSSRSSNNNNSNARNRNRGSSKKAKRTHAGTGAAGSSSSSSSSASSSAAAASSSSHSDDAIVDPMQIAWNTTTTRRCKHQGDGYHGTNMVDWLQFLATEAVEQRHTQTSRLCSLFETKGNGVLDPSNVVLRWVDNKKNLQLSLDLIQYCKTLLSQCQSANDRFLILPLEIGKQVGKTVDCTHAGILLVDFEHRVIMRIDPNGVESPMPYDNTLLDAQLKDVFLPLFPEIARFLYVPLSKVYAYNPAVAGSFDTSKKVGLVRQDPQTYVFTGPQRKEGMQGGAYQKKQEENGYCLAWSLLLGHYMVLNPNRTFAQIIDYLMSHSAAQLRSFIREYNCLIIEKTDRPTTDECNGGCSDDEGDEADAEEVNEA